MENTDDRQRKLAGMLRGEETDGAFAQELRGRYPYFTLPDALLLRRAREAGLPMPEGEERQRLLSRIALNSCDPAAAERFITGDEGSVEGFYPPEGEAATPTTESAIDTFLNSYGSRSDEEDALLERLIFNPVPDYSQVLEAEEAAAGAEASEKESRISEAPAEAPNLPNLPNLPKTPIIPTPPKLPKAPASSKAPSTAPADSLLSESLAKIFIKTKRYDKAYEILERLSLEFPEKSRYFADQLRFLRKLILIEEHRRKQQGNTPD
ncbi:MAG: hypothetical protein NC391_10615 [Alistipes timonensis]|nr:hypothetical protein [Alistipes timonensis]